MKVSTRCGENNGTNLDKDKIENEYLNISTLSSLQIFQHRSMFNAQQFSYSVTLAIGLGLKTRNITKSTTK